jgi:hypothetical protein
MQIKSKPLHIKATEEKRNRLVCEILEADKTISGRDALSKANAIINAEKKNSKFNCYNQRNVNLEEINLGSYSDYLNSPIWHFIRNQLLSTCKFCFCCTNGSSQIHHMEYSKEALLGLKSNVLIPICDDCHKFIEFSDGIKNSLEEANRKLQSIIRKRCYTPKIKIPWKMIKKHKSIIRLSEIEKRRKFFPIKKCKSCEMVLPDKSTKLICKHCMDLEKNKKKRFKRRLLKNHRNQLQSLIKIRDELFLAMNRNGQLTHSQILEKIATVYSEVSDLIRLSGKVNNLDPSHQ